MLRKKKTNRRQQIVFAAIAAVAIGFAAMLIENSVIGQSNQDDAGNQDDIQYGVVYDCGAGKKKFIVVSCEGDDGMDRCKVRTVRELMPSYEDWGYRQTITNEIAEGCKPKSTKKKQPATKKKDDAVDAELEPEEKPAPKPKPKSTPRPVARPTPEEEPEDKNEPAENKPADEPSTTGPQFQLGDCIQVGNSQGVITKSDGENFYVQTGDGEKRVPLSSVPKLKKATGCG